MDLLTSAKVLWVTLALSGILLVGLLALAACRRALLGDRAQPDARTRSRQTPSLDPWAESAARLSVARQPPPTDAQE